MTDLKENTRNILDLILQALNLVKAQDRPRVISSDTIKDILDKGISPDEVALSIFAAIGEYPDDSLIETIDISLVDLADTLTKNNFTAITPPVFYTKVNPENL